MIRTPYQLAQLVSEAYANGPLVQSVENIQYMIVEDDDQTIVAFPGSNDVWDWLENLDCVMTDHPWGRVHEGFARAWQTVEPALRGIKGNLRLAGHSLGGAIATLAAADYREE